MVGRKELPTLRKSNYVVGRRTTHPTKEQLCGGKEKRPPYEKTYRFEENRYMGRVSTQLNVKDIRVAAG